MQINVNYLKAANVAASKDHHRYYLNGVAVQGVMNKGVFIVGTDGHRAVAFRQSAELPFDVDPFDIIIPSDTIAALKTREDLVELTKLSDNQYQLGNLIFTPIDGTFPDWRRIAPKQISNEVAQFNPVYVGDFGKIAKILKTSIRIAHNGYDAALVTFSDDIDGFGLLMPTRVKFEGMDTVPAWATI